MLGLHLTPAMLEQTYELLRVTPPFRGWHLPAGEKIKFVVGATPHRRGHCWSDRWNHEIMISLAAVSTLHELTITMAHEMIHVYQYLHKRETANTEHNADFKRLAARVCSFHLWDAKAF